MNELDPKHYIWFIIPGFSFYDINVNTKEVRSNKHWKSDSHHIMKEYDDGCVVIVDDYGESRRMDVDELYDLTFNSDHKLRFRANSWQSTGGMLKFNRNREVAMNYSQFVTPTQPTLIKPFKFL